MYATPTVSTVEYIKGLLDILLPAGIIGYCAYHAWIKDVIYYIKNKIEEAAERADDRREAERISSGHRDN